ncbi:MAG TPA: hypothetical protein VK797_17620 [Tepidisphaeraceae bacterium]|jgi:hypothetical protein|nr:hypothetical protein [Tepidisphaeraceae bacterium]
MHQAKAGAEAIELRAGDRVGSMRVVEYSNDRIELKARLLSLLLWLSLGGLCAAIAAHGWFQITGRTEHNINVKFLLLLSGGAVVCFVLAGMHLGLRTTFDRQQRAVTVERLFGAFSRAVEAQSCRSVRLSFVPGGAGNSDDCHLELASPNGERAMMITGRGVDKSDSANLIVAAQRIAAILNLPIEIEGDTEKACKPFSEALSRVTRTQIQV